MAFSLVLKAFQVVWGEAKNAIKQGNKRQKDKWYAFNSRVYTVTPQQDISNT